MVMLDVGCGPGTITMDFAVLVPGGRVIGIDDSSDVIEKARLTASQRGIKNISFEIGDAHAFAFPDDTFDVVHGHQVLQHIAGPVQALAEWRRVAKPGGILACRESDMGSATYFPEIMPISNFHKVYRETARCLGGEPDGGRHLVNWALNSGISRPSISASASVWCFSSMEERNYWSGMWADRLQSSRFAKNAIAGGHATQEDLDRIVEGWHEWASCDEGWYTLTHGEIICHV